MLVSPPQKKPSCFYTTGLILVTYDVGLAYFSITIFLVSVYWPQLAPWNFNCHHLFCDHYPPFLL